MEGQIALALTLALPIVLFPAAFIWYLNIGGTVHAICMLVILLECILLILLKQAGYTSHHQYPACFILYPDR